MSMGAIGASVAGAVVAGAMNDGGGKVETSQRMPWWQEQRLRQLLSDAESGFYNVPREYYPGSTVAGQNQFETGAFDSAAGAAGNISSTQLPMVHDANQFGLNFAQDIPNNPVVQAATEAAINPVQQRLERQILPGLDSSAVMAGQVGSSRHGVVQANALNDFSRAALDATANVQNNALTQGLNLFSNTLAQQPAIAGLEAAPANILDAAGQRRRTLDQQQINADIGRHNFQQNEPLDRMQQYRDLIMGNMGGTAVRTVPGPSDAQAALGTGLSMYSLLGGGGGPRYQPTATQINRTSGYSAPNDGLRASY